MRGFRIWFETDVEAWRSAIDRAAAGRDFPFASWFPPEGRVYIPFQSTEDQGIDDDVAQYFDRHQYKIQDYAKGLAVDPKGRVMRIGKLINKDEAEELKKIQAKQASMSPLLYQKEITGNQNYYKQLRSTFEAS